VYPEQIAKKMSEEIPFMATEIILMAAVEKGESRQDMHEAIKEHSFAAGKIVKEHGGEDDLLVRLADDKSIPFSLDEIETLIGDFSQFTGMASEQTERYLSDIVAPLLKANRDSMTEIDSSLFV
ncbi:MAG: adenylosuccinate lyase, partial [Desulfobulbia bacterium]